MANEKKIRRATKQMGFATGFTLVEVTVIAGVILVLAAFSVPALSRTIDNVRIGSSAQQLAAFYQQARIRTTQDDTYYSLITSAPGTVPATICMDLDGDGACGANEPSTSLLKVSFNNAGAPAPLDRSTLGFDPIQNETSQTYSQQGNSVSGLAWNARGLPCQRTASTSPCANYLPTGPVGWAQYLQLTGSGGSPLWGAVTVSPTGRVRTWAYRGNGNWE